jgi:hypothetical protein
MILAFVQLDETLSLRGKERKFLQFSLGSKTRKVIVRLPLSVGIDASPRSISPNTRFDLLRSVREVSLSSAFSCIMKEYSLCVALPAGWSISMNQKISNPVNRADYWSLKEVKVMS